jgi:MFS family permease
VIAAHSRTQHHLVVALLALWVVGYVGLLLAPGALAPLWMALIGLGQGVGISLALTLITLRSPDAAHTAQLSGMAQGVGYVLAAAGPLALGAIHDATGSWTAPIITLLVLLVPLAIAGAGAARARHVGGTDSDGPSLTPDVRTEPCSHPAGTTGTDHDGVRPTLSGVVRTAGGTPLAGAAVTLVDDDGRQVGTASTDASGTYELPVPPTSCVLVCAAPGHEPDARRAAPGRVEIELAPRPVGSASVSTIPSYDTD